MSTIELPEIERTQEFVSKPGIYRLLVIEVEQIRTQTDTRAQRVKYVTEELVFVYGFLTWPEDAPKASWAWEDVLEHPRDIEVGMIFYASITRDLWEAKTRNKVGKLYATRTRT